MEVQERKNSVQKDVEDYKLETQRFLNEMNQKIREGKAAHMELTNEVSSLETIHLTCIINLHAWYILSINKEVMSSVLYNEKRYLFPEIV